MHPSPPSHIPDKSCSRPRCVHRKKKKMRKKNKKPKTQERTDGDDECQAQLASYSLDCPPFFFMIDAPAVWEVSFVMGGVRERLVLDGLWAVNCDWLGGGCGRGWGFPRLFVRTSLMNHDGHGCDGRVARYIHTYIHTYVHTYVHTYGQADRLVSRISLKNHVPSSSPLHACIHTYIHTKSPSTQSNSIITKSTRVEQV